MLIFAIDCWCELIAFDHILVLELATTGLKQSRKSTWVFLQALNLKLRHPAHPSLLVPSGAPQGGQGCRDAASMASAWSSPGQYSAGNFPRTWASPAAYGGHVWGGGSQPIPPGTHLPHPCSPQEHPCTTGVDGGGSGRWSLSGKEGIVIYFFFPVESHTEMSENWTLFIGVRCLP